MVGFEIPSNTPSPTPSKSAASLGKFVIPGILIAGAFVVGSVIFMTQGKNSSQWMISLLPAGSSSALPSSR